jgi:hypothetical protein
MHRWLVELSTDELATFAQNVVALLDDPTATTVINARRAASLVDARAELRARAQRGDVDALRAVTGLPQ